MEAKRPRGRPRKEAPEKTDVVARVRAALKLTQEEFARELRCSIATVRRYEQQSVLPGGIAQKLAFAKIAKRAGIEATGDTQTKDELSR